MKASIITKLETLEERYQELAALLSDPEVIGDQKRFRKYSCEYSELEAVVACFARYRQAEADLSEATLMLEDEDPDLREMAAEESESAKEQMAALSEELQLLLLPKDPNDGRNIYLEIRAGAGGDEAAIFAGDLFRMYSRYAEKQRWKIEVLSASDGEHGGYKEVISRVVGSEVYGHLKFESGGHRVQRVPETESQGRVHTSACTVAIIPEPDEQAEVNIRREDLRIDTFRSSGAGGQHVNTTDSAVRLTHLPTGIVVECQDERSQHKNKARAMSLLAAKIEAEQTAKQAAETASLRKGLVGSGDRSERVRTYNYPQGRVSDHRINLTLYRLPEIVAGDLDCVIQPLRHEEQAEMLAALADND